MKNQYIYGNLMITASSPWKDITDAVEGCSAPFTLSKSDGTGALQFSVAKYRHGRIPNVTLQDLNELRNEFAQKKGFGRAFDELQSNGPLRVSGGSYQTTEDYVRVWYCSDGRNVALITYLGGRGKEGNEPNECDAIVSEVRFG